MPTQEQRVMAAREYEEALMEREDQAFETRRFAPQEDLGHYPPPALLELVEVTEDA